MFALAATLSVSMAPPAQADYSYNVYESRSTVKQKAGVISGARDLCGKAPWAWNLACKASSNRFHQIYDYASYHQCKMRIRVTINTSSKYSFDKATYTYYPYQCLRK